MYREREKEGGARESKSQRERQKEGEHARARARASARPRARAGGPERKRERERFMLTLYCPYTATKYLSGRCCPHPLNLTILYMCVCVYIYPCHTSQGILEILTSASEFDNLPMRHGEEKALRQVLLIRPHYMFNTLHIIHITCTVHIAFHIS